MIICKNFVIDDVSNVWQKKIMIIIKRIKMDDIVDVIRKDMKIDEPGKGIIFDMDINRASGIYK